MFFGGDKLGIHWNLGFSSLNLGFSTNINGLIVVLLAANQIKIAQVIDL